MASEELLIHLRVDDHPAVAQLQQGVPTAIKKHIESPDFRGQIPNSLLLMTGAATTTIGDALAPAAGLFSLNPVSNFAVGAVVMGAKTKSLYFGTNIEFSGSPICYTIHAEQAAVTQALSHGEESVAAVCVSAAPCGHCRQFLVEHPNGPHIEIRIKDKTPKPLSAFLPDAFTAADLEPKPCATLGCTSSQATARRLRPLAELQKDRQLLCEGNQCQCSRCKTNDWVVRVAIEAAERSRAPFSGLMSGVALQMEQDDEVFAGSYNESAAFNPSMQPFNAAFISARFAGRDAHRVKRAVMVEYGGSNLLTNINVTRELLKLLNPNVQLEVYQVSCIMP